MGCCNTKKQLTIEETGEILTQIHTVGFLPIAAFRVLALVQDINKYDKESQRRILSLVKDVNLKRTLSSASSSRRNSVSEGVD